MASAALSLKRLRERAQPRITIRAMAERLGMPATSYARYEDPNAFKKPTLPVELTRRVAAELADHGVDHSEVMALAGVDPNAWEHPQLSAAEQEWLDIFAELTGEQRSMLMRLAREFVELRDAPISPVPTVHQPGREYRAL